MSVSRAAGIFAFALFLVAPLASAAPTADTGAERMVLCQDSWLDWQKAGDPRLKQLAAHIQAAYTDKNNDPFSVPNAPVSILGLRVLQIYPGSVGMGLGFSVLVDAPFDKARASLERALGKKLVKCDTGDGMKECELQIAEQRTVTMMSAGDPKTKSTLLGCYYYYEK